MQCQVCGCTDDRACITEEGPCSWHCQIPPICSACAPIVTILSELLNQAPAAITGEKHLQNDLGADDPDRAEAIMLLECEFDVDVIDADYKGFQTVADLVSIFLKLRAPKGPRLAAAAP